MSESTDPRTDRVDPADPTERRKDERFDEALRAWASRPPATPAPQAARRIADRLPERGGLLRSQRWMGRRTPTIPRRMALAATVVLAAGVALVLGLVLGSNGIDAPPPTGDGPIAAVTTPPPTPPGDVLVIDLDPRTTLYLNLGGPTRK
jgi:hypothetical protein